MVAAFKELVFDFSDLKLLSVICKNCNIEMIIDLSKSSSKLPEKCPTCKTDFDENFIRALHDYYSAYSTFTNRNASRPVSARVRVQSDLKDSETKA